MTENGQKNGKNGQDSAVKRGEGGRFLPGTSGGPGRPQGKLDLMSICRRKAAETGQDLELLVWEVVMRLGENAKDGDVTAAKLFLERLCGAVEKMVPDVNIDARQVSLTTGPQDKREMREYLEQLVGAMTALFPGEGS